MNKKSSICFLSIFILYLNMFFLTPVSAADENNMNKTKARIFLEHIRHKTNFHIEQTDMNKLQEILVEKTPKKASGSAIEFLEYFQNADMLPCDYDYISADSGKTFFGETILTPRVVVKIIENMIRICAK